MDAEMTTRADDILPYGEGAHVGSYLYAVKSPSGAFVYLYKRSAAADDGGWSFLAVMMPEEFKALAAISAKWAGQRQEGAEG